MFQGASNFAEGVDRVFLFIFAISAFFLIGITITMVVFIFRYNRKKHPKPTQIKDNMKLELAWTLIPLALVLAMFYYGYIVFRPMREAPKDAMEVKVTGMMWSWTFEYPNGKITNELWLPVNKPVKLNLYSRDVIHSLYIPAFRIKEDLVPGKNDNYMWFIPMIEGSYDILCAEYCGLRHSFMESKAVIVSENEFEKWLSEISPETIVSRGLDLLKNNACTSCHSLDGSPLVGPSFKGLYGSDRVVLKDGKEITVKADTSYIRRAILEPDAEVVKGFNKGMMRAYNQVLKEEEIKLLLEYFQNQPK